MGSLPIPSLGLGCAQLGDLWEEMADETATAIVDAAWDAGIRYFDTAPHYGVGLSEQRLGRALSGRPRDNYVVSTKVGRLLEPHVGRETDVRGSKGKTVRRRWDFSRDGVLRSLDSSLERLGLDRVDIALLHDSGDRLDDALSTGYAALAEVRDAGLVGAIGAGDGNVETLVRLVAECELDVILLAGRLTLLDHTAQTELVPLCRARGVRIIAAGVFNTGVLAAPDPRGARFEYQAAHESVVARARSLAAFAQSSGVTLQQLAIQYPLGFPEVRSVVVGADSPEQIAESAASFGATVPDEVWAAFAELEAGLEAEFDAEAARNDAGERRGAS